MKDFKLTVHLRWRLKKKIKGKMNKSRHLKKTQNELKVLSPSPALVQRHGKEGPAQTAPGLGKSRRQTRFNFSFAI